jgi:hypothetical protein
MPLIDVDEEQAALIEAGINAIDACLAARVVRADPNKVLSNSMRLQRRKVANMRDLLAHPPKRGWDDLHPDQQVQVFTLARALIELPSNEVQAMIWQKIVMIALAGAPRGLSDPPVSFLQGET